MTVLQAVQFTHGFVAEFENEEDRAYYITEDPAHIAFGASMEGLIAKPPDKGGAGVMDFTPDVF